MRCPELKDLPEPPPGKSGWPWTEESPQLPDRMEDGSEWPRISIVTPNYNYGRFIEETIRSVLLQGYPNLEYIIIDGASTDNSVEIIKKYEPWLTYWESKPDRGQSHAINKGFEHATGEIYAWLNSDDVYLPDALAEVGGRFPAAKDVGAIVGVAKKLNPVTNECLTVIPRQLGHRAFLDWQAGNWFMQPSCFFARRAWNAAGPLDEELHYAMDLDLWLKMAKSFRFVMSKACLSVARTHPSAKTIAERPLMHWETAKVVHRHGGEEICWQILRREAEVQIALRRKVDWVKSFIPVQALHWVLGLVGWKPWQRDKG